MRTLYALPYSPWSEKARWALDHHGIAYREVMYAPPIDEVRLRIRTRNLRGRLSVPLMLDGRRALTDSWDIAVYADELGAKEKLIPASRIEEIRAIDELSQRGLDAGRVLVLRQGLADDGALAEMAPRFVRRVLGPLTVPVVRRVVLRTQRKWGADVRTEDEALTTLGEVLAKLQRALAGKEFVLGTFSYADVAASQLLGMVSPVVHPRLRIGERTRARFTVASLAETFHDLVLWRDGLYEHRRAG